MRHPASMIMLTHWGRVTHICVGKLTVIGSDNGLSPGRRQAIIWTNVGILSIRPLETNFSEILIKIYTFSFKKMHLKISSGKWRPYCLGLNELSRKLQYHYCISKGDAALFNTAIEMSKPFYCPFGTTPVQGCRKWRTPRTSPCKAHPNDPIND